MVALNSSYASSIASYAFPTTLVQAEAFDVSHNHNVKRDNSAPFSDGFYDDEAWWAMGWIRAYDATGNTTYLKTAEAIFQDMTGGWGTKCSSSGMWWDKGHTGINPIANVLFLETAAYLAGRVPSNKTYYLGWAENEWDYFQNSPMYSKQQHLVGHSLNTTTCEALPNTLPFTYTQGTLIQGLTELAAVTGNQSYLSEANLIAQAVIGSSTYVKNGILVEPGVNQQDPGPNAAQFKGVFMRGMQRLIESSPSSNYSAFVQDNANSIWSNDRQGAGFLGASWVGPFTGTPNASIQSSAMDGLVAAWSATQ